MPLGASVTFGVGSTTGNSYRKDLRDLLVGAGMTVNMVGTEKNGNFADNDCEAFSGFVIDQIAAKADAAVPQFQPNLILVDAGTNNCNSGAEVPAAGKNVSAMIDRIFTQSPGSTVILTTLLVNKVPAQDQCRVSVNAQYASIASDFQKKGNKVILVDMRLPDGPTTADLFDTRHPNDVGYSKMAKIWFQGIQEAQSKGFLTATAGSGIPADGDTSGTSTRRNGSAMASKSPTASTSASLATMSTATSSTGVHNVRAWASILVVGVGLLIAL
jgi:lysophospholipase L1-like esterase